MKYHLGTSFDRPTLGGKRIHLSLMANPSHLEAVNTVVQGKVRAKQYYTDDKERERVMPILLHGDGSFAGQGVVMECLDMSQLPDYAVGGTIHLVVNNQVAFTTDPKYSRSSVYCTDVAKGLGIPVFHVNGDDVEAVVHACELAVEWRQKWKSDVVVDIVCYRRYGHNEIDDPMFTQPLMYKVIKQHRSAYQQYADKLVREGTVSPAEVAEIHDRVLGILNKEFDLSKNFETQKKDWLASMWTGFKSPDQLSRIKHTGVALDVLKQVGVATTTLPEDFTPHRAIARVYDARRQAIISGEGIDWALAEQLAFGTLMAEGNHVRLSGQARTDERIGEGGLCGCGGVCCADAVDAQTLSGKGSRRLGSAGEAAPLLRSRLILSSVLIAHTSSSSRTFSIPSPPTIPNPTPPTGRGARHVQPPARHPPRPDDREAAQTALRRCAGQAEPFHSEQQLPLGVRRFGL